MVDVGERVMILRSGQQPGGSDFLTPEAVHVFFESLVKRPVAIDVTRDVPLVYLPGSYRLSVVVGSVTEFLLESLVDGGLSITGRLTMFREQPRSAG